MKDYPEFAEIKGKIYKINTDFRIAIECEQIAKSKKIGDMERTMAIIYKLFGEEGLNDFENYGDLIKIAITFLTCGKGKEKNDEKPDMSFAKDKDFIEASFMSDYHIDLSKETMHWWKFIKLLNGLSNSELGNCCVLNNIRNMRRRDPSKIKDPKERQKLIEAQEKFSIEDENEDIQLSKEQEESIKNLNKILGL